MVNFLFEEAYKEAKGVTAINNIIVAKEEDEKVDVEKDFVEDDDNFDGEDMWANRWSDENEEVKLEDKDEYDDEDEYRTCSRCDGAGCIEVEDEDGNYDDEECYNCEGEGVVWI